MCVLSVSIVVNSRTKCYYVIMQWICANISGTTCNIMLAETETDLLGPARTCPIHSRRLMTIIIVGYANIKHDAKVTYWNHRFRIAVIIIILRSESEESPRRPFAATAELSVRHRWNFDRPLPVLDVAAPKVIIYYGYLPAIIIIII